MSRQCRSAKNKFHQSNMATMIMSVGEYVERTEERRNYLGRIISGVMEVCLNGHWVSQQEFDELVPPVIVMDFKSDTSNCDNSRKWMIL